MGEVGATLLVWVVGSVVSWVLLRLDRRRLDAYGRARDWNEATTALAMSGLFFPAPLALGAHVWVTRRPPWWSRLTLSIASVVVSLTLTVALSEFALWVLDLG